MQLLKCVAATGLVVAGLTGYTPTAKASPLSTLAFTGGGQDSALMGGLVHKVSGCHQGRQYHMVYRWNTPAWHRHRPNCVPVAANPPAPARTYCHRGWQSHPHPAQGGRGSHRHVGPNCVAQWR